MKFYDPNDWFWYIADDKARVYSSAKRDYVSPDDPSFMTWATSDIDPIQPSVVASEADLGAILSPYMLRPIPQGILDGYLDAQIAKLAREPDFKLWLDVYAASATPSPTGEPPTEEQIMAHIRELL